MEKKKIVITLTAVLAGMAVAVQGNYYGWSKKSEYMKTWPQANSYCRSKGMRLPTRNEIIAASKKDKPLFWPAAYWTSEVQGNKAYVVYANMRSEKDPDMGKSYAESKNEIYPATRCKR